MDDDFDFDYAMCIYLGGKPDTGAIQIGMGDERLKSKFGSDAPEIKTQLNTVLELAVKRAECAVRGIAEDDKSITSWLATELPSLSDVCRRKIEAHVLYRLQH